MIEYLADWRIGLLEDWEIGVVNRSGARDLNALGHKISADLYVKLHFVFPGSGCF
jgi:hypothetical protein